MVYGVYRERTRSAVFAGMTINRDTAIAWADRLADEQGGAWCVAAVGGNEICPDVIHFATIHTRQEAPVIHRSGDYDTRSPFQPQ